MALPASAGACRSSCVGYGPRYMGSLIGDRVALRVSAALGLVLTVPQPH